MDFNDPSTHAIVFLLFSAASFLVYAATRTSHPVFGRFFMWLAFTNVVFSLLHFLVMMQ